MGTKSHTTNTPLTPASLADALFTPVQQRVLGWLFGQPERRFQSGELPAWPSPARGRFTACSPAWHRRGW